jgi:uncharacterized protein
MMPLEVGCSRPLLVREETLGCATADHWRILHASDLHLTPRRAHLTARLCEAVERARPDAVLLGGDLIDRRSGLPVLQHCTAELGALAPVFAIDGNHDRFLGAEAVRAAVTGAGGHWLTGNAVTLRRVGRPDLHLHGELRPFVGEGGRRVLVAHHPRAFVPAAALGYDHVLAGHLHGGQCVLWQRGGRLYPGAWLCRWNGLRFEQQGATLLVSRGVADTLPIRFRCPREVLLCRIR